VVDGDVVKDNEVPIPGPEPADAETRAKFDANWKTATARAVAAGIEPADLPPATATKAELKKAQRELVEEIVAREKLNAEVVEKTAQVKAAHGPDAIADVDPGQCTSIEVHQMLATLNEMLGNDESPSDDDGWTDS
jgi:hypothetical protein